MSDTNISSAATSDMSNKVTDYSVGAQQTEGATGQKETEYMITKAAQYLGYYKTIPELKKAIDFLAIYSVGKGWVTDAESQVILEHFTGWGEDTFNSIAFNLFCQKKIFGDAFAEIIRDTESGEIINIKPLDPASIKTIVNDKGIVERYEQVNKTPLGAKSIQKFKPKDILHLCNDRIADEIHGVSVIDACEWVIKARNEAMEDQKKLMHRNVKPIIFFKLDTDDQTKIDAFIAKMDNCVNKGENIYVPKGNVEFEILSVPANATLNANPWIQYLENFFYQAVGVPKVIVGGSQELTEATAKIAFLSFQTVYEREQAEFEADMWNQLNIRIKLNKPVSLKNELLSDESKDSGTMDAMPQDEMATGATQE